MYERVRPNEHPYLVESTPGERRTVMGHILDVTRAVQSGKPMGDYGAPIVFMDDDNNPTVSLVTGRKPSLLVIRMGINGSNFAQIKASRDIPVEGGRIISNFGLSVTPEAALGTGFDDSYLKHGGQEDFIGQTDLAPISMREWQEFTGSIAKSIDTPPTPTPPPAFAGLLRRILNR